MFDLKFNVIDRNEVGKIKYGTITLKIMLFGSSFYTISTLGDEEFGIVIVNSTISYPNITIVDGDPLRKKLETSIKQLMYNVVLTYYIILGLLPSWL